MAGLLVIMRSIRVTEGEVILVGLIKTRVNYTFLIDLPSLLSNAHKLSLKSSRIKTGFLCIQRNIAERCNMGLRM